MSFIVAEIGVNWNGDFEILEKLMQIAKDNGCNTVKFQAFEKKMVLNHPLKDRLLKSNINENNIQQIDQLAKSIGIEWFCTPMYPDAVNLLEPYVKRFKIRELDGRPLLKNMTSPLLERVLQSDKEIIVSTQQSPIKSKYYSDKRLKWLYCVPKYPCAIEDLDFSHLSEFDGFSNHYPGLSAPLSAAILGANIIEIHITYDKTCDFIDNNVSFDPKLLQELVTLIRISSKLKK